MWNIVERSGRPTVRRTLAGHTGRSPPERKPRKPKETEGNPEPLETGRGAGLRAILSANVMPFTLDDQAKLEAAISDGRGARSMTFSDQSVVFNSIPEMLELLAFMRREIGIANGTGRNFRVGSVSKGV